MKFFIVGLTICLFPLQTKASVTTIWGTNHRSPFNFVDSCGLQNEFVLNNEIFNNKFNQIPNFIFATEIIWGNNQPSHIESVDDIVLHNYASLFAIVDEFNQLVRSKIKNNEMTPDHFAYLENVFYARMGVNKSSSPYYPFAEKSKTSNSNIPRDSTTRVNVPVIVRWDNVDAVIKPYMDYARGIAKAYFEKNIQPYSNKYNIPIGFINSSTQEQKMFDFARPENLFAAKNFVQDANGKHRDKTYDLVIGYWRDYFISKNIIKLITNNVDANILAWMGDGHIRNISWLLNQSKELSLEEKKSIRIISKASDEKTACSYNEVLKSFTNIIPNKAIPLPDWHRLYADKI